MQITLTNCNAKLQAIGIILANGDNEKLTARFQDLFTLLSWDYSFEDDTLRINVPDGITIPSSMSNYGDVML